MRLENLFCEECGKVHFVEVVQRDRRSRIIKTKCHGADFSPIVNNPTHYTRHRSKGFDVIRKFKYIKNSRLAPKKKTPKFSDLKMLSAAPVYERTCVAELSMSVHGKYVTIKVFADATPEKFYEFFSEVGDRPTMVKPRTLGRDKPVHIQDLPNVWRVQDRTKLVYHNREAYEKLLILDPDSITHILESNAKMVAGIQPK